MLDGIVTSLAEQARFKRRQRLVRGRLAHEDLGAAAPHHHEPIELVIRLELADVGDDLIGQVQLVGPFLDVGTVEPLHVLAVEDSRPRLDGLQFGPDLLEQVGVEHARRPGGLVAVVVEQIPPAKHDVVQPGKRQDIGDSRRTVVRALAQAQRAHLAQRSDRLGEAPADRQHAGDDGGADGAQADQQNPEFARRGRYLNSFHGKSDYIRP